MPRKKKADPRRNMTIRLNDAERAQLDREAERARLPVAKLARARLLGAGQASSAVASMASEGERVISAMLAIQLRAVGVNLNQWVKKMHETDTPPPPEARLAVLEIRELVRRARTL